MRKTGKLVTLSCKFQLTISAFPFPPILKKANTADLYKMGDPFIHLEKMGDSGNIPQSERANEPMTEMEKLFQCTVCLSLPICNIYQCSEGHLICKDCHARISGISVRCPTCKTIIPTPPSRCRAAEQVITYKIKHNIFHNDII